MSKRVYLDSVGCRLNQSEIAEMARSFETVGYEIVSEPSSADLFVVNTCAVTNDAGKESRKMVRQLGRQNPEAQIAVTGCYAHLAPQTVKALPNVQHVFDNFEKDKLVAMVTGEAFDIDPLQRNPIPSAGGGTRAFLKVQDGCNNECTFCVTTVARGPGRSRPLADVIAEAQWMESAGYQEIVLTGVHLGSYGHDLGQPQGLALLIQALLKETTLPRFRLSSLEPWDLDAEFFALWRNPRLCRHLHLPLQSGCDRTLRRMRRHTNQAAFRQLVAAARATIPDLALSTDMIVGFPGEDEAEFAESLAFVQEMDFMKIHVFPYSVREGTAAARMRGRVDKITANGRLRQMLALSESGNARFMGRFIGQTMPVLWEGIRGASEAGFRHIGLTDHYIRVEITHHEVLTNTLTPTRLVAVMDDGLRGELTL